jgi:serine/threonine protein phosphatase PrpC
MIQCATRTRSGALHDENQDRVATDVDRGIFIVVDGMGGLADAAATAQVVVDQFPPRLYERVSLLRDPDIAREVTCVLGELNVRVRDTARSGPGTTGAATALVLVRDNLALAVHLGDSRIYLVRKGRIRRLTEDHVEDGHLTQFVGMPGDVAPGVSVHELVAGDRILLCTDGLTGSVDDRALGSMLTSGELDRACGRLVDAATHGGAVDDISVVAVEFGVRGLG